MLADRQAYAFASEPRTVPAKRKKYRDPYEQKEEQGKPANIMHDRRVIRGNTYAAQVLPLSAQQELAQREKEADRARKRAQRKKELERKRKEEEERSSTPPPVENRKHIDIQTELYLEEIRDRPVETDMATQTDPLLDRPPSPIFIPTKTGIDKETQIYEGDLFDFDLEVEPLLETLVGKTMEQSLLEVMQEEELAAMKKHQEEFEQLRNAELAETQRMEAAEKRKWEEKERRKEQERRRLEKEKRTQEKLAARKFAKSFLSNLQDTVFSSLSDQGFFYDHVEKSVKEEFLPFLFDEAEKHLNRKRNAQKIADQLVGDSIITCVMRSDFARKKRIRLEEEEKERIERLRKEEELRLEEEEQKRKEEEERARLEKEQEEEGEEGEEKNEEEEEN